MLPSYSLEDGFGGFLVVGVRGAVTIREHLHPAVPDLNQTLAKSLPYRVARTDDIFYALPHEKVFRVFPLSSYEYSKA